MRSTEATALSGAVDTAYSGALEDESDVVVAYRLRSILDDTRDRLDQAGQYVRSRVLRVGINTLPAAWSALSRLRRIGINSRDEWIGINSRWEPDGSV